ncbi:MAG: exonuclease domain-containing protein, partial [Verrucomicrobiota bacterium]
RIPTTITIVQSNTPKVLESRYYLDHFHEMMRFIRSRMEDLLEESHKEFMRSFESLSRDAQCLYVRFANRKGRVFYRQSLRYEEIGSIPEALNLLENSGFARQPREEDWKDLLVLQTRPDLFAIARQRLPEPVRSNIKKRELVSLLQERLTFADCFEEDPVERFIVQDQIEPLDYLFFLYYGKLSSGLTALALRDLGLIRQNPYSADFRIRFESREAALAAFSLQNISALLESPSPATVAKLAESVSAWPKLDDPESAALYHRAVYQLGRELERCENPSEALQVYQHTDEFPATERAVRLLVQNGASAEAKAALHRMIDNPSCDAELIFAEDFYERKFQKKKVGRLTEVLRSATVFKIDETNRDRPEAGVVSLLARQGELAFHTENLVWNQLFGLLFWDLLFKSDAPLHNEFERKPWGLDSGKFYETKKEEIESALALLDDQQPCLEHLEKVWEKHEGTPNALVSWFPGTFAILANLVERAPQGALAGMLRLMAQHHRAQRSGFPDLLVFGKNGVRFIEIKTEGDKISRKQLTRLEQLRRFGFKVEVGAVQWAVDPEQEYVVVDIETTGSKASWNRVTEIGAVRVQDDRILEEWTSLVNPGRRIPKSIVALTGITDEMVAEAPPFEAIADEFREFVGDAVFVAHRASFDYGFLKAEFERLEQHFRCPTLCTVVTSRRVFPGLRSYGLANLCREFEISLDSHHRALCDARATAEILIRINQRRLEMSRAT